MTEDRDFNDVAPQAKISVSSVHEGSRKEFALDGDPSTAWLSDPEKTAGQWLQLDWVEPQAVAGVVLHQAAPAIHALDVLAEQSGQWITLASAGVANQRPGITIDVQFPATRARSLRMKFIGRVALRQIEVREAAGDPGAGLDRLDIAVAGNVRGGVIGTVSRQNGELAVEDAEVTLSGDGKAGPWQRTAVSGPHGFFDVELPLGIQGPIRVEAVRDDLSGAVSVEESDLMLGLTPQPADQKKHHLPLEGRWDFALDPPPGYPEAPARLGWKKIKVPSHWEMEGFTSETGLAVYRRTFRVPAGWRGDRIKFRAEAIYSRATVYVNSRRAGSHEGGTTPFEMDITDLVEPGRANSLLILVDERSAGARLDNYSFFSYFELAGIWRPLQVFRVPPLHISRLTYLTTFDAGYKDAVLSVEVALANEQDAAASGAALKLRLLAPNGKEVRLRGMSARADLAPWERKHVSLRAPVKAPKKWTAETPDLYTLVAEVNGNEVARQAVGFRQLEIDGRVMTINGERAKLWGVCRLEAHPLEGRALSRATVEQDLEMIREANANAIRMTICPPEPRTLDLTDQYGFYVENEGPYCWAGGEANDLRWAPLIAGISSEYFERDRNHPSVVIWSICNESTYGRCFFITHDLFRQQDPSRPTSAGQSAQTEIATFHNPTNRERMQEGMKEPMPVLFDEGVAAFHGWGMADAMDLDPGARDYWVTGAIDAAGGIRESDQLLGLQLFGWVDDNFAVPGKGISLSRRLDNRISYMDQVYKRPGRGVVGDYVWGMVDGWRRPKPEYWLTKKLFSPAQVDETSLKISRSGAIRLRVENRGYFTNLNRYLCRWRLSNESGELRVSVPPQQDRQLVIKPAAKPHPDDTLVLEFFDSQSRLVDGYRIPLAAPAPPAFTLGDTPARIVVEKEPESWVDHRYLEQAKLVRLLGRQTEIALDKITGEMLRGLVGREMVFYSGLDLHLMPADAPLSCNPQGWTLGETATGVERGAAILTWRGSYGSDYTGGFVYKMDDAGNLQVEYDFTYQGAEMIAREIGLRFEIPLSFDRFEWDRKAEWSYYPDDHIGRPRGAAVPHPKASRSRPYGLDDHPWGCNDFRSAKRNINWAAFSDRSGHLLRIVSDGTQTVRATVGVHAIAIKVLDYYGGSPSPIPEYTGLYTRGSTIRPGDRIQGVVRLQLEAPRKR